MLIAIGRNLMIVISTLVVVGVSVALWPIGELSPERQLEDAGAKLACAFDGILIIGAALDGPSFGDDHARIAARIPSLHRISLVDSAVTGHGIRALSTLPELRSLSISKTHRTVNAVPDILCISTLRELQFEDCEWLRDEHIEQLIALPNLEVLDLSGTSFTPAVFEHLARFPALKHLNLSRCSQIDDSTIDELIGLCESRRVRLILSWTRITLSGLARLRASLPGNPVELRAETMVGLRDVAPRGQFLTNTKEEIVGFRTKREPDGYSPAMIPGDLAFVSTLPQIQILGLEQSNLTDDLLLEVGPMPLLEILRLSSTLISDVGLQALTRFPNLQSLFVLDADLNGEGLVNLRSVPNLQRLQVQTTRGDDILDNITQLQNLQALVIHAPITDAGMDELAKLRKLNTLELIRTRIRSNGIQKLASLPELTELVFDGGLIDDSDLEPISQIKTLRRVVFARTKVTREGKKRLSTLSPGLAIAVTLQEFHPADLIRSPSEVIR